MVPWWFLFVQLISIIFVSSTQLNSIEHSLIVCRTLINQYGHLLSLEPKRVPGNAASSKFSEALARAWAEFNVDRFGML